MNSQAPEIQVNKPISRWPICEMLLRGTYGTGTPAESRLILRSRIVFGVVLGWAILGRESHAHPNPVTRVITVFLPAVLCSYYAFEKRKYFLSLDELTQRIELEGMAWAYSLGVLAALWAGGICYALALRWPLDASLLSWRLFFLFAIALAAIKGIYRYFATRRY